MALSRGRWLLWCGVGFLALTVGIWPPAAQPRFIEYFYGSPGKWSRGQLVSGMATRYAVLLIRDSLVDHAARPSMALPLSVGSIASGGQAAARLTRAVDTLNQVMAPVASNARTLVVDLRDRHRGLPGASSVVLTGTWYALPQGTDGHLCIVIPGESELAQLRSLAQDSSHTTIGEVAARLFAVMGPCAFYAEFGLPGPKVEAWLRRSSYETANAPDWPLVVEPAADNESSDVWDDVDPSVRACAHRQWKTCRDLLLPEIRLAGYRDIAVTGGALWFRTPRHYLSDLVRRQGRTRFAQFWTSQQEPETAFQEAFGMPMTEWTSTWLLSYGGRPHFGPEIEARAAVWSLVLVVVLVSLTIPIATRRQVG